MSGPHLSDFEELHRDFLALRREFDGYKQTVKENNDAFFKCSMAIVIFFMQCGFAFLEAGCIRSKNVTNLLLNNVLESLIAGIGYWSIGWAFAYGPNYGSTSPFIGGSQFFLIDFNDYSSFFFQYVFAATASTIITGAVAERIEFFAFCCYSFVISSVIYPILAHWGWSEMGWMKIGIQGGDIHVSYQDFAGSGMVHLCGGSIALLAAWIIGSRIGKFPKAGEGEPNPINGHSISLTTLGGFILMFGFLAFNGGSTAEISSKGAGNVTARAMVNTILSGAFSTLSYLLLYYFRKRKWSCLYGINACLAGMVAACGGCNTSQPWATTVIGIGAGFLYMSLSTLALKLKIDDPLDAFAVHFGGGLWGLVSVCLIGDRGLFYAIFYNDPGFTQASAQLGWNLLCAVAIILWSIAATLPMFVLLKIFKLLRVPAEIELKGLDIHINGEPAYPIDAYEDWFESNDQKPPKIFVKTHENGHVHENTSNGPSAIRPIYNITTGVSHALFLPVPAFDENVPNQVEVDDVRYRRHHSIAQE